jgi:hypothetical protein
MVSVNAGDPQEFEEFKSIDSELIPNPERGSSTTKTESTFLADPKSRTSSAVDAVDR